MHCVCVCVQVSFTAIQAALDVAPHEVEGWVVRAIGAKLLDGRIDQVTAVGGVDMAVGPPCLCGGRQCCSTEPSRVPASSRGSCTMPCKPVFLLRRDE